MRRNVSDSVAQWCLTGMFLIPVSAVLSADPVPRSQGQISEKSAELQAGDVNIQSSRVYAFVDKTGFGHQHAVMGRIKSGSVQVADKKAGRLEFDMTSFVADTPEARRYLRLPGQTDGSTQRQVTQNMLGDAVLDVGQFPTALFDIDSVRLVREEGGGAKAQYELVGVFTLHGVAQKLKVRAEGTEEHAGYLHLIGNFPINQTGFSITPYQKALGAVGVADRVQIYGDLWIVTDPAAARAAAQPAMSRGGTSR